MSIDITLIEEIKNNGTWYTYSKPRIQQNYNLFALMNHPRFVDNFEYKGFPEDASEIANFCFYSDPDQKFCHWLNDIEIRELMDMVERDKLTSNGQQFISPEWSFFGFLEGNGWDIVAYPNEKPHWVEDIRFIYWFDQ